MAIPIFALNYMRKNYLELDEHFFKKKWNVLYTNLDMEKTSVYMFTSLFCLRRLFLSVVTTFTTGERLFIIIFFYVNFQFIAIGFLLRMMPFAKNRFNLIELLNEIYILISVYFTLCFTSFIPEPGTKSSLGECFMWMSIIVLLVNITLIVFEIHRGNKIANRKKKFQKAWKAWCEENKIVYLFEDYVHERLYRTKHEVRITDPYYIGHLA